MKLVESMKKIEVWLVKMRTHVIMKTTVKIKL